ncbi:probable G-protein coupled receptor 33 [Latimeria chalumnae]|uniref:probable G-protein coupled receptor 33 n=1 Tax=Latimeria chalumnae TaxID=7897 RepID=UPI0003C1337E|nr:PREDICTED: probable G-protein coupled receptor 33 [Latimeria chalumnae]|eukprot:XP_006011339.1 PREDICTED: probable G-protein coupled receptor 33 [Latimeria chalumnae]
MEQHNSTPVPAEAVQAGYIAISVYYWVTFLLGMSGNSLIIWVTGFKMQKSPNTIWFLNLAAAYLIFTLTLPFFATYRAMGSHWPFGMALCKVLNTTLYFTMSTSIWLLVAISVDRCLLVLRPIWSHNRRTPRAAFAVSAAIWISTFIVTSPYLVFRQTHVDKDGRVTCYNNYAPSMDRNSSDDGTLSRRVHTAMFTLKLLLGFVIPFFIITVSYVMLAVRISVKRLLKSSKPFKVIAMNITSFFVCWTPYHVLNYTLLNRKSFPETTLRALFFLASSLQCINCCFTPILYVFITEGYRGVFKRSLFSLFESAFKEETLDTNSRAQYQSELSTNQDRRLETISVTVPTAVNPVQTSLDP